MKLDTRRRVHAAIREGLGRCLRTNSPSEQLTEFLRELYEDIQLSPDEIIEVESSMRYLLRAIARTEERLLIPAI